MLLGLAAGKIGDLVFYRDGGEQRTRTRVIPKNPRSIAQQTQRSKVANVSAIYRLFASVLQDSFVNRPSNQSGFNAFAQTAIGMSPYQLREQAAQDCVLPMPAFVSKGTLPTPPSSVLRMVDGAYMGLFLDVDLTPETTAAAVSQAMLAAIPTLQEGDIITFMGAEFTADSSGSLDVDVYRARPVLNTFVVDSSNTATIGSIGFGITGYAFSSEALSEFGEDDITMSAIIISRVEGDGRLNVTNAQFNLNTPAEDLYNDYRTAVAAADAAESYRGSKTSILRD